MHQGRFARPRRPHHGDEFALCDRERRLIVPRIDAEDANQPVSAACQSAAIRIESNGRNGVMVRVVLANDFIGADTGAFNEYRFFLTYHFSLQHDFGAQVAAIGRFTEECFPGTGIGAPVTVRP